MIITAIPHCDEYLGSGYYLMSEAFDEVWYKGKTAKEAVGYFFEEHFDTPIYNVTIIEKVR